MALSLTKFDYDRPPHVSAEQACKEVAEKIARVKDLGYLVLCVEPTYTRVQVQTGSRIYAVKEVSEDDAADQCG